MRTGMNRTRGQALLETAMFLPCLLLATVSVIYFSQYGILQVRAVQAVRYASLVSNAGGKTGYYSIESVYNELWQEGHSQNGAAYPATFSCSGVGTAQADQAAISALYQSETLPSGSGAPAPAFFQADVHPSATCTASPIWLSGDGNMANSYFVVQFTSVTGVKNLPSLLQKIGLPSQTGANAGMAVVLPGNAALNVYCSPNFASTLAQSFAQLQPGTETSTPVPYGSYPVAGPNATPNPSC
jgi:hypothetical protein